MAAERRGAGVRGRGGTCGSGLAVSPILLPLGLQLHLSHPLVAQGWDVTGQDQIQLLDIWKAERDGGHP